MSANPDSLFKQTERLSAESVKPFPNSRKVWVTGDDSTFKVGMREVVQTDTPSAGGAEHNPPVTLYDTSGPYTDPEVTIDLSSGLPPLRAAWIEARADTILFVSKSGDHDVIYLWNAEKKKKIESFSFPKLSLLASPTLSGDGQSMVFSYTPRLRDVLNRSKQLRRRASSMYLFATQNGTPQTTSGFNSAWRRLKNKVGLSDFHYHDIRAKALTDAKRKGGSDYAQALGNHTSVETTENSIKAHEVTILEPLF